MSNSKKSTKSKIIDSVNNKFLTGEADFTAENMVKAHSGLNLIVAQEMIDSNAAELQQSMEFIHNGKKYKYELNLQVSPINQ